MRSGEHNSTGDPDPASPLEPRTSKPGWSVIAGLAAAGALAARGFLDLRSGSGAALLIVAALVLLGTWLRHTTFRD